MLFTRVKKYTKVSIIQFFNQYSKQAAEASKVTQKVCLLGEAKLLSEDN
jgi:hypothetical protein